jgi:hypothetical protein
MRVNLHVCRPVLLIGKNPAKEEGAAMKPAIPLAAVLWLAATGYPSRAQFVRPPVIIPRPPVHIPVHVPVHGPHGSNRGEKDAHNGDLPKWVIGGLVALLGLGVGSFLIQALRKRSARRSVIRIIATPPGEAPESVRRGWVGLELPLVPGQTRPEWGSARQVLSGRAVGDLSGYAVDGPTAIKLLTSADPEAAAWWRQNAPHVLASGYQLVFPAHVCERPDDPGT